MRNTSFGIEEEYFVNDAPSAMPRAGRTRILSPPARRTSPDASSARCSSRRSRSPSPPYTDFAEARTELGSMRAASATSRASTAFRSWPSGTHPLAVWTRVRAEHAAALRQGHARPADDRQPHGGVRHARPCRGAGSRDARRHDEPHAALSAAAPRALDLLAVLAGAAHRPSRLSARRLSRTAAHRPARICSATQPITSAISTR